MTASKRFSGIFRRSNLGTGCYIIRDDDGCDLPDAETVIHAAVVAGGAATVSHSGMFQSTQRATALPGGFMYEMVGKYGFGGLPERAWVFGPTALRHILRLIDVAQPSRLLASEESIPDLRQLTDEWTAFAATDRLTRVSASLGALAAVAGRNLSNERLTPQAEPISLPTPWSTANPPPDDNKSGAGTYSQSMFDPRISDSFFWKAETTSVHDSAGSWILAADGSLTPATR